MSRVFWACSFRGSGLGPENLSISNRLSQEAVTSSLVSVVALGVFSVGGGVKKVIFTALVNYKCFLINGKYYMIASPFKYAA